VLVVQNSRVIAENSIIGAALNQMQSLHQYPAQPQSFSILRLPWMSLEEGKIRLRTPPSKPVSSLLDREVRLLAYLFPIQERARKSPRC